MAHIDAGKTTTTERMLYYSGFSKHLGDVDDGDTVMDYMEQERARGITITSAAVTFHWNKHRINLIDTPGHVDFTVEVERALRVLDGAVAILDASAGVEAQTLTVWRQADKYHTPRIVYLNKMDKRGANIELCMNSLREKLKVNPLLIHLPIGSEKAFSGIVDLVSMKKVRWSSKDGNKFDIEPIMSADGSLHDEAINARNNLIGQVADFNEKIAEFVLNDEIDKIPEQELQMALREVCINQKALLVLCGSSLKNVGVQALLDAITFYLPSPKDINYGFAEFYKTDLCALAFKIIHDKQRGPLTFLRIYSGILKTGANIYNVNRGLSEKITRLLQVYADDFKDISSTGAGNIVCVSGLKQTVTGDTLTSSQSTATSAQRAYNQQKHKTETKVDTDMESLGVADTPVLAGLDVLEPVFFCSVEPPSLAYQKDLDFALECLQREDPSLKVEVNEDTGQTVLSGMGELHLEVIKSRILKEYGVDVDVGPLQIAYRETISRTAEIEEVLDKTIGDRHHQVQMKVSIHPCEVSEFRQVKVIHSKEHTFENLKKKHLQAINNGIRSALSNGPILNFPIINVEVHLESFHLGPGTSMAMISACASMAAYQALKQGEAILLEPMMKMEINTDEDRLHSVLADLSRRRGQIQAVQARQDVRVVDVLTPLSELMGYSTDLRTTTSGTATFTMELSHYENMTISEQNKAIENVTGFRPPS
ncbi:hypothetical protein ScPMuIL_013824 [Solemya velum]